MNYDRKFLVPYLENLFNLELIVKSLTDKENYYNSICTRIEYYINNFKEPYIELPIKDKSAYRRGGIKGLFYGSVVWLIIIMALGIILNGLTEKICILIFIICCIIGYCVAGSSADEHANEIYNSQMKEYSEEKAAYASQCAAINQYKKDVQIYNCMRQKCKTELENARTYRETAYSANIIPKPYRDIYCIKYLYDYFSSSNATDLDQIIQTLLLDNIQQELREIKRKLDIIIQNQNALIDKMNYICNKADKIDKDNEAELKHLAQIESNQQLQTSYLQMIQANEQTNNYISTATFLEIIKRT